VNYQSQRFSIFKLLHIKIKYLLFISLLLCIMITNFVLAGTGLYVTTNDYVTQSPYTFLCWAATSVSMVQTKNINTDVVTHVTSALGTFRDTARERSLIANDFNSLYNISATLTGTLSVSTIRTHMAVNKPIYASVNWFTGGGHGVAISGIDILGDNGLRIMDPAYGWQYPSYDSFKTNYLGAGFWAQSIFWN